MEKRINIRHLYAGGLAVVALLVPVKIFAQTVQFDSPVGMYFGLIEYASTHSGTLTLATNGGVALTGSGLFYQGDAVPGHIGIVGNTGVIDLQCETTAQLGGSTTLQITNVEVAVNAGVGAGSANHCQGVAGGDPVAVSFDLGVINNPTLYFGGVLNITANALNTSTTLSTSLSGGHPITISAVFQ